jgi:Short C-terminal domain/Phospholipase_D-nuclease N-terminal
MTLAADDYPLVDLLWTFVYFFALLIYFWLLITVFGDLFRRRDLSGWGKTAWVVFVIVLPLIGSFSYLITQGREMGERNVRQATALQQQTDDYIRSVAAPNYKGLDEVARAKKLLDEGAISEEEFQQLKRRVLV